jgi:hypothetical protein
VGRAGGHGSSITKTDDIFYWNQQYIYPHILIYCTEHVAFCSSSLTMGYFRGRLITDRIESVLFNDAAARQTHAVLDRSTRIRKGRSQNARLDQRSFIRRISSTRAPTTCIHLYCRKKFQSPRTLPMLKLLPMTAFCAHASPARTEINRHVLIGADTGEWGDRSPIFIPVYENFIHLTLTTFKVFLH